MNKTICTECGDECDVVFGQIVTASDEWGDHSQWGDVSECCHADWREEETPTSMCWKCSEPYDIDEEECPDCGATNPNVDLEKALAEFGA